MKFITSLYVEYGEPPPPVFQIPFIPRNVKRLSVVVSTHDTGDSLLAYGVDLTIPPASDKKIVFERVVQRADLGAFLKIIVDGKLDDVAKTTPPKPHAAVTALSADATGGGDVVGYSIDITTANPKPIGPSAVVVDAYAESLGTTNTSASTPPPA